MPRRTESTPAGRSRNRHGFPRVALWAGGAFLVAAALWVLVGIPALVKYPSDLDVTPTYEGTFTVFADPTTAAPLAEPLVLPLAVSRHIQAIPEESGSSLVLVEETIRQQAGDLVDSTQRNVYVMDRSTLENVADDRAYAFDPANVVDRSGAFRVNLPFDTSGDESYAIYQNELDSTYQLVPDESDPTGEIEGLDVLNFTAVVTEEPVTDAYVAEVSRSVPLPTELTLDQLAPVLLEAGIDVDAVIAALTPVLTPDDAATLAAFAAQPIALDYVLSFEGRVAIEPTTGAQVEVEVLREQLGARPDLSAMPLLLDVLARYPQVPEAVAAGSALQDLAAAPAIPAFEYSYAQTPASVAETAALTADLRSDVLLARQWVPLGLSTAALLAFGAGALVARQRRLHVPEHVPPEWVEEAAGQASEVGVGGQLDQPGSMPRR
jgi:hypothetical protein